jgi:hypothetical protein
MMSQQWAADDQIMADVATALRSLGEASDAVAATGHAAFAYRFGPCGPPVASISYDSLLEGPQLRDAAAPRTLEFDAAALGLEIEVSQDRLCGQLIPPSAGVVEVLTLHGKAGGTRTDDLGCFTLPLPPPGPVRFRCRAGGEEILTDWVRL